MSKLLYDNRIDALGVSETKLIEDMDDSELVISNYEFFRKDRNEFGGGVAFYVSTRLHAQRFFHADCSRIECLWLKLFLRGEVYQVGVIYRPPSETVDYWD